MFAVVVVDGSLHLCIGLAFDELLVVELDDMMRVEAVTIVEPED